MVAGKGTAFGEGKGGTEENIRVKGSIGNYEI